jgi:hypothetical protein
MLVQDLGKIGLHLAVSQPRFCSVFAKVCDKYLRVNKIYRTKDVPYPDSVRRSIASALISGGLHSDVRSIGAPKDKEESAATHF